MNKFNQCLLGLISLLLLIGILNIIRSAVTGETTDGDVLVKGDGLSPIDWGIVAAYAAGTITLGWYVSQRRQSSTEYFIGSGRMNPVLVGISLFATLLSTISYLSMPGESMGKGPARFATLFGWPFIYVFIVYIVLPIYMKKKVTSAYELLEEKLGLGIRLLGGVMFITLRLVWMSLLIYDGRWPPLGTSDCSMCRHCCGYLHFNRRTAGGSCYGFNPGRSSFYRSLACHWAGYLGIRRTGLVSHEVAGQLGHAASF